MPKSPKKPSRTGNNPNIDQGVGDQELEDRVGRRPDEKPEMVPPGTTVDRPASPESSSELDDEAIEADRANARKSDRTDARDGVDPSDTLPQDPDGLPGAAGATRSPAS